MNEETNIPKVEAKAPPVATPKPPQKPGPKPKAEGASNNPDGRPEVDIDKYFALMLPYLQRGMSMTKSCEHAGVPHQTVSDHMKKNPEFSAKIKNAQRTIEILARKNIANMIEAGSPGMSTWWLERKCKEEFSPRVENLNENHESEVVLIELPKNGRDYKDPDAED